MKEEVISIKKKKKENEERTIKKNKKRKRRENKSKVKLERHESNQLNHNWFEKGLRKTNITTKTKGIKKQQHKKKATKAHNKENSKHTYIQNKII